MHRARTVGPPPKSERPGPVRQGSADLGKKWKITQQKAENWKKKYKVIYPNIVTELYNLALKTIKKDSKGFKRCDFKQIRTSDLSSHFFPRKRV